MRVVQALHWLQDVLPQDGARVASRLRAIFADSRHGDAIVQDLRNGMHALPGWMQDYLRPMLADAVMRDN